MLMVPEVLCCVPVLRVAQVWVYGWVGLARSGYKVPSRRQFSQALMGMGPMRLMTYAAVSPFLSLTNPPHGPPTHPPTPHRHDNKKRTKEQQEQPRRVSTSSSSSSSSSPSHTPQAAPTHDPPTQTNNTTTTTNHRKMGDSTDRPPPRFPPLSSFSSSSSSSFSSQNQDPASSPFQRNAFSPSSSLLRPNHPPTHLQQRLHALLAALNKALFTGN